MKMIAVSCLLLATGLLSACVSESPARLTKSTLSLASGVHVSLSVVVDDTFGEAAIAEKAYIANGLEIRPAKDESGITHYRIYWGDLFGELKGKMIARVQAKYDGQSLSYRFPEGMRVQKNADYIVVCSANAEQSNCGPSFNVQARAAYKLKQARVLAEA